MDDSARAVHPTLLWLCSQSYEGDQPSA